MVELVLLYIVLIKIAVLKSLAMTQSENLLYEVVAKQLVMGRFREGLAGGVWAGTGGDL